MGSKGAMRLPDCTVCNLPFFGRQNRLTCSECNVVVHSKCGGADTAEKFELIVESYKCKDTTDCLLRKSNTDDNSQLSSPKATGRDTNTPSVMNTEMAESLSLTSTVNLILSEVKALKRTMSKLVSENSSLKKEVQNLSAQLLKHSVSVSSTLLTPQIQQVPATGVGTPSTTTSSNKVLSSQNKVSYNKQTYSNAVSEVSEAAKYQSTLQSSAARGTSSSQDTDADDVSGDFTLVQNRKNRRGNGATLNPGTGLKSVPPNNPAGPVSRAANGPTQHSRRPTASIGASASSSIKSIAPVKRVRTRNLFITRFDPTVTDQIIQDHLKSNLAVLKYVKITRLSTRHETYASFHVEVSDEDFSFINNSSIWPEGILFKEFLGRLKPEKCYGHKAKPDENSGPSNSDTNNALGTTENNESHATNITK